MSEVILKAVAEAIASTEVKFEQQLQDIKTRVAEMPPIVGRDVIDGLIDEVKSMHQSLYEEVQEVRQTALDKTGLVQQELRKEIVEIVDTVQSKLTPSIDELYSKLDAQVASSGELHELLKSIREELQSVNNDTLSLTANGLESLTDRVDFIERSAATSIELLQNNVEQKIADIELTPGPQGPTGNNGKDGSDGVGILVEAWKAGIFREGKIVSHYLGQYFKAKCDTSTEPGTDDTWERLGSTGFRHRGGYDAEKAYEVGDLYVKDFATFACLGAEHVLWAARGPVGPRGEKGADSSVQGPKGEDGAYVKQVHTSDNGFVLEMTNGEMHAVPFPPEVKELFASPGDFLPLVKLKSIAATSTDFKSFQAAIMQL